MISRTAEYALRAAVCLADDPTRPITTSELARRTRVPLGYLAKVMQLLVQAGLVTSRRGKGGGFNLALPPDQTTVLGVIDAVDPIRRLRGCPLGLLEHAGGLCPLHRRLDQAAASVERALGRVKIASLRGGAGSAAPLCPPRTPNGPSAADRGSRAKTSIPPLRHRGAGGQHPRIIQTPAGDRNAPRRNHDDCIRSQAAPPGVRLARHLSVRPTRRSEGRCPLQRDSDHRFHHR